MKVTDKELEGLIASQSRSNIKFEIFESALKELQSYRKVYGVLSADDLLNGATVFEELKHGVEEAIKEIDEYFTPRLTRNDVGFECQTGGVLAIGILKKHVSKYLEGAEFK